MACKTVRRENEYAISLSARCLQISAKNGGREDYVLPLFTTVKVDFFDDKIKDLLLTPLPEEDDKLSWEQINPVIKK